MEIIRAICPEFSVSIILGQQFRIAVFKALTDATIVGG